MTVAIGDRTSLISWYAAETIKAHAWSTSGIMRAASSCIESGVYGEGNAMSFGDNVFSIDSTESCMSLMRALISDNEAAVFVLM